jgi:hypothetical protein
MRSTVCCWTFFRISPLRPADTPELLGVAHRNGRCEQTNVSFVSDRVDRNEFDVQFEQALEQPIKRALIRYYAHKVCVAIGAISCVESVDRRNESRAQYSAHDYLESVGRQRKSFQ